MSVPLPPSVPARASAATVSSPVSVACAPLATLSVAVLARRSAAASDSVPASTKTAPEASVPLRASVPASMRVLPV